MKVLRRIIQLCATIVVFPTFYIEMIYLLLRWIVTGKGGWVKGPLFFRVFDWFDEKK